jgi:hypothetical protein
MLACFHVQVQHAGQLHSVELYQVWRLYCGEWSRLLTSYVGLLPCASTIRRAATVIKRSKGKHNRSLKVAVQGLVLWPTPYTYITLHYTAHSVRFLLFYCLAYSSALKMEVVLSSEASVIFQTTRRHILEDNTLYSHLREASNPRIFQFVCWTFGHCFEQFL